MRDCTTCKFDTATLNCGQGHMRVWRHDLPLDDDDKGHRLPIEDCHAFKQKEIRECKCSVLIEAMLNTENYYIVCKRCGRAIGV